MTAVNHKSSRVPHSSAIRKGRIYIESLGSGGQWAGFPTLAGRSNVWVTAFVIAHLSRFASRSPLIEQGRRFLAKCQGREGGWGYGGKVPSDADSTAWCMAAMGRSPRLSASARRRAFEFLLAHRLNGGFATYRSDSGIRQFIGATEADSLEGWVSTHPDVTAAVLASGFPFQDRQDLKRTLGWVFSRQTAAGLIDAYWWRCPFYTLTLALRACALHKVRPPRSAILGATEVLLGKQLNHGGFGLGSDPGLDAFTTALALEAFGYLAGAPRVEAARLRCVSSLLSAQRKDGGWDGAPVMRIPAPGVINPAAVRGWREGTGGGNSFVRDEGGVFATVLACHALDAHSRIGASRLRVREPGWEEIQQKPTPLSEDVITVQVTNPPEAERCDAPNLART